MVYGRSDVLDQLHGFKLYIGNVSRPWIYNQELPIYSSDGIRYVYKPNDVIASVIALMRSRQVLTICEVIVEGECLDDMFSEFCNKTCGKCFAGQPCNKENGTCPLGCHQGWKGSFCKEGCERGKYGYNCNETCGNCLYGNISCSTSDGNCTNGCIAGWQGYHCSKGCDTGKYGYNCNETCGNCLYGNTSCFTSDGRCNNGCEAGWQGDDCKQECRSGTHGYGCNETCANCYKGIISCSMTDGRCMDGCEAGWRGDICKFKCESGTYGFNCNETCGYCLNGKDSCSTMNGQCNGACQAGWKGETCKSGTSGTVNHVDVGPNTGVIVGSVLAAVGVSIFTMIIIIVIAKYRRKKNNNETSTENVTTATHYANLDIGNPDTAEKTTTFSGIEEASQQKGMPIGRADSHIGVKDLDVPVDNEYEFFSSQKLRHIPESAYSTIEHSLLDYQGKESMENSSNYVENLQSLERALKSVDEKISVLLDRKEKLLCKELEIARANKRLDKRKKKNPIQSDTNNDSTDVNDKRRGDSESCGNFVQMLQSLEGELRLLEEERKCFLERKENLLRQELAKTTEEEK
ncbi:hypothetical protein CHS0354_037089 [Potamilus streckersoni]|uniref:Uncharacterized protein n=1 Tax=Potamilus streckersoni TaxID=2493646 RepID=A0AAE0VHN2_9BIVA|nr:hypothetical protein CHS0354_037089 [Potamilus streckersoni]